MRAKWILSLVSAIAQPATARAVQEVPPEDSASALLGDWTGVLLDPLTRTETPFAMRFEKSRNASEWNVSGWVPVIGLRGTSLHSGPIEVLGERADFGEYHLRIDPADHSLRGKLPRSLSLVHELDLVLHRTEHIEFPPGPKPDGVPEVEPIWEQPLDSPCWAGPVYVDGDLYVGCEDGTLHALDSTQGELLWHTSLGGAVRARPSVNGDALYVVTDDGLLHRLDPTDGSETWQRRLLATPVHRSPFDQPDSRFDRTGAEVVVRDSALYVGTHDGRMLALSPEDGSTLWEFATGDSILAAPLVQEHRVVFGSFDKHLYALDRANGELLWKLDTQGEIVSTPAFADGRYVVGNRAYDLLGVDEAGTVAWRYFLWFSWVESTAVIADGIAYVGSSDAATLSAVDVKSGALRYCVPVYGWAWGQPVVTEDRVVVCTSSQAGYSITHHAGVLCFDRKTGKALWQAPWPGAKKNAFGYPGSATAGEGVVYVAGLDGVVRAFEIGG